MQYHVLTGDDFTQLLFERVGFLEREHFAASLQVAEATTEEETAKWQEKMTELARRIAVHIGNAGDTTEIGGQQDDPAENS